MSPRGARVRRCVSLLASLRTQLRQASTRAPSRGPLKLAIIGAGPSGFYTASRVLASLPYDSPGGRNVEVHMYERLPTPYGLVRYGVAPDHPEVKHKFDELSKDPRFRYFGNVLVTSQPSIPSNKSTSQSTSAHDQSRTALSPYTYPHALRLALSDLTPRYNALLLSYGASLSNPLSSVTGSSSSDHPLENVHPALALVGWYNGHPAFADLPINLRGIEEVAVIGQGNVALDVARILLKPVEALEQTDIPDHVLNVLGDSAVRKVTAVGRRGPGQVAFTTKEFREMTNIPELAFKGIDPALEEQAKGLVKGDRMRTRLLGLMAKMAGSEGRKEFGLSFLQSPSAFLGGEDRRVREVEWVHNELVIPSDGGAVSVKATSETSRSRADMVVESVGYRSEPLGPVGGDVWTLPFDERRGRVSNVGGRVVDLDGHTIQGVYAAGWVSRGPIGVIASTMQDAYTVADQMLLDHHDTATDPADRTPLSSVPETGAPSVIERGLKTGEVVDIARWEKIDAAERERGRRGGKGKEREKFVRVEEMLAVG